MKVTTVGRAHGYRYNKRHHLQKGMPRLILKSNGEERHCCRSCARPFLTQGVARL